MTALLDSNVLIALAVTDHEHHLSAQRWLDVGQHDFATCPITQGALTRQIIRTSKAIGHDAREFLAQIVESERHVFWPDDISYLDVPVSGLIGHKQVTDAYLAQLARNRTARLATFDRGLAALHADVTDLIPTQEDT